MKPGPAAHTLRDQYLEALRSELRGLDRGSVAEILDEIRSHLEDSAANHDGDPASAMQAAIEALGPASSLGQAMLPEALLRVASQGFHPTQMARALGHTMLKGLGGALFGLLFSTAYLALLIIAVSVLAKLCIPASGLYLHADGDWSLSFGVMPGAREVLGWWLVPLGTLIVAAGWWWLGWLLRRILRK